MDSTMIAMKDFAESVSKQLMEQAQNIEGPRLRDAAERVALTVAAREREEPQREAHSAPFARVSLWMFFLPITNRQRTVLGRIYSFQCSTNKDGSPGEYRMSIANGAKELDIDRDNMKIDLQKLTELSFITKRSNGERKPSTRLVDEVVCMAEARRNGYTG